MVLIPEEPEEPKGENRNWLGVHKDKIRTLHSLAKNEEMNSTQINNM